MKKAGHFIWILIGLLLIVPLLFSCSKPKEGKVEVTSQEFFIRQDNPHAYVMDAKGKIKNVGEVDVKNVVVTGYCRSCVQTLAPGRWFVSGTEKTPDQKDTINYLSVGQEAEFSFRGVAFIYNTTAEEPKERPQQLEVEIESFETVK